MAPLPGGSFVYVISTGATTGCSGESNSGQVQVINTNTNTVVNCITVGGSPVAIAPSSDSSKIYVVHQGPAIGGLAAPAWQANRAYGVGAQITDPNGNVQQVLVPGTSGSAQPVWATTVTSTTEDGTINWTDAGLSRGTTIINTATSQVVNDLLPPYVDPNCFTDDSSCVLMSPVTVVTGP
jgi:YVTN family beta-propeller protein